ncbi:MAG: hypothetical protein VXX11_03315 [Planctomycetota bacterium]|nr:hypothetical protein [Planctomycetota bacterium]|tara:strand:- start:52 stop:222 length:171 start_codon:yes stop_codon:yes gene_type:complete
MIRDLLLVAMGLNVALTAFAVAIGNLQMVFVGGGSLILCGIGLHLRDMLKEDQEND